MPDPVSVTPRSQLSRTLRLSKPPLWSWRTLGHALSLTWAIAAGSLVAFDSGLGQWLENQVQTTFFELRGPVTPPGDIVILTIDETSLAQTSVYQADPQRYAYLKPIQSWPWQRSAYATVIDRLMAAGARAVALDILLATPSSYGPQDDARLQQTLQRHAGAITLAASYETENNSQGELSQLTYPTESLQSPDLSVGFVNYLLEADGRVHRLGHAFLEQQHQLLDLQQLGTNPPAFAPAVLQAAQLSYPAPRGDRLYFFGPAGTFPQHSFVEVLDPSTWQVHLQRQTFQGKVVLIGATATSLKDFPGAPFGLVPMSGVEIHANAIATLLTRRAIAEGMPGSRTQGAFVFLMVLLLGIAVGKPKRTLVRGLGTLGCLMLWAGISYASFTYKLLILPTGTPLVAIALCGLTYSVTGSITELRSKRQLRRTLQQYSSSPIVQEIISQQEDLQDLLLERERAIFGKTLGGRYRVIRVLGSGGFGETFVAQDLQRPGYPQCVVKLLRPMSDRLEMLQLASRLFEREAATLERLGKHDQIPQLLAYFEENQEFYLVQELIEGHALSQEMPLGKQVPEAKVIEILHGLLSVLQFVHQQGVIHRDIKPGNVIRRQSDGRLVLIDFGAVKEISAPIVPGQTGETLTIGIGTQGYTASEQCAGNPQFNSDIYGVGMTVIRALTGLPPHQFQQDAKTGNLLWQHQAKASHELVQIISRMVHHDFTRRYPSVEAVLADLEPLLGKADLSNLLANQTSTASLELAINSSENLEEMDTTTAAGEVENTAIATDATDAWTRPYSES